MQTTESESEIIEISGSVASVTAEQIIAAHNEVVSAGRLFTKFGVNFIYKAAEVGKLLIAKKQELGHGNWMPWLAENVKEFSIDTAHDYMKAARYSDRGPNLEDTSLRSIRDLRQAVALLDDKEETASEPRAKPPFVIKWNIDPSQFDEYQRKDAISHLKPALEAWNYTLHEV